MNQRIRQLAEQAVNSIPDHVDFDIPNVFKQKFAELIVRECIDIVPLDLPSTQYNKVMQAFEKHFGETE